MNNLPAISKKEYCSLIWRALKFYVNDILDDLHEELQLIVRVIAGLIAVSWLVLVASCFGHYLCIAGVALLVWGVLLDVVKYFREEISYRMDVVVREDNLRNQKMIISQRSRKNKNE